MPFAAFVGVDYHSHSTLLVCGLISNEDIGTFVWLFQSWLACILNCEDRAMQKAIEIVFPGTRHRWCLWHIMKKLPEKLRGYNQYESIKFSLQNIVYDSLTHEEFEERWNCFIDKHNLQVNEWLLGLYNERRRWVPTFVKDTFWAVMSTTQCCESMHPFFDGYVNSKTTLKQFVEQYDNALRDKVEKENEANFKSFKSWILCISTYAIEKQFQDAYTTTKFKEFQQELAGKLYCQTSSSKEVDSYVEFIIEEDVLVGETRRPVPFVVCFDGASYDVRCNCQLFEFRRILCRHAITVLIHKRISCVPEKYILRRWKKNISRYHTKVKISYNSWSTNIEGQRFDKLSNLFSTVADLASTNEDDCNMMMNVINDLKNKLISTESVGGNDRRENLSSHSIMNCESVGGASKEGSSNILNPRAIRSKGHPLFKRKQSSLEQIETRTWTLLKCTYSLVTMLFVVWGELGHCFSFLVCWLQPTTSKCIARCAAGDNFLGWLLAAGDNFLGWLLAAGVSFGKPGFVS
ncbi:protein FAR-RED IMPAIRED RESPONSE 1-like [Pistacia vera]|uniref:protein FAR-RED IMPAIRED RESPONSE 1-like n=1 Tax=Pistacia vera TaxID=55513 RepID=UPI00126358F2|nr:protein FAR-RED IMPAIRED RESPONSE 1-like [Pistacia vera]